MIGTEQTEAKTRQLGKAMTRLMLTTSKLSSLIREGVVILTTAV